MAIVYFDSSSNPVDNSVLSAQTVTVPTPASMLSGDLVILCGIFEKSETTDRILSISNTGGQTWNNLDQVNSTPEGSGLYLRLFWCIYNGTWTSDPVISVDGGVNSNISGIMHVFRSSINIFIDVAQTTNVFSAPGAPYDVDITGINTLTDGALVFATWGYRSSNTWVLQTALWSNAGVAQYRNGPTGSVFSASFAYKVVPTAGDSGVVVNRAGTSNSGVSSILAFSDALPTPTNMELMKGLRWFHLGINEGFYLGDR